MRNCIWIIGLFLWGNALAQGNVRLDNNAWIVLDNGAFLVLDESAPTALITGPGGGNILSEAEDDRIRWNIGSNTGTYTIPWTNANSVKIPLVIDINSAGSGNGHFILSTHSDNDAVDNWNNFDYRPSDVTHMNGFGLANNSPQAIDRFWRIEHSGFSTAPQVTLSFAYDDAERTATGNAIPAASLFAQRFSPPQDAWLLPGLGTDQHPTLRVSNAVVSGDFFKSWTLANQLDPLPVEFIDFVAQTGYKGVVTYWEVPDQDAIHHFDLERSGDGIAFEVLQADLSAEARTWLDAFPLPGTNHYRLRVFGEDGQAVLSEVRRVNWEARWTRLVPQPGAFAATELWIAGAQGESMDLNLIDALGRTVWEATVQVDAPLFKFSFPRQTSISKGIYLLVLRSSAGYRESLRWRID